MLRKFLVLLAAAFLVPVSVHAASVERERVVLTTQNTIVFRGAVDGASITAAQVKLAELAAIRGNKPYKLYLVMDSPGGSIVAGDAFIEFAKTIPNLETVSIFSASMAAGIVEALPGRRLITKNGVLMFHRARGGFEGQFEEGEIEAQLAFWKTIVRAMEQTNADRMSMSLAEYKAKIVNEYWLYGRSAVEAKAADKEVDLLCSKELINSRSVTIVQSLFMSASLEFSGCPLFRAPIQVSRERE